MLKYITFAILAAVYMSLAHNFEREIMNVIGNWNGASQFYFFVIFLLPTIIFTAMAITAHQAWTERRKQKSS